MINKRTKYLKASDEELAAILCNGAHKLALAELYKRYGHLVYGLCLKYFKHQADAEDMTSSIFIQLQQKIAGKSIENFKSWLFIMSKNECLMKLRKKNHKHIELHEDRIHEDLGQTEIKQHQELKYEELESAINQLNQEQALVIKLFYLEQKTYKVISETYNIPLKKVKSAIQNGKRNLRIKLEEHDLFKSA